MLLPYFQGPGAPICLTMYAGLWSYPSQHQLLADMDYQKVDPNHPLPTEEEWKQLHAIHQLAAESGYRVGLTISPYQLFRFSTQLIGECGMERLLLWHPTEEHTAFQRISHYLRAKRKEPEVIALWETRQAYLRSRYARGR